MQGELFLEMGMWRQYRYRTFYIAEAPLMVEWVPWKDGYGYSDWGGGDMWMIVYSAGVTPFVEAVVVLVC